MNKEFTGINNYTDSVNTRTDKTLSNITSIPSINLPKGGGGIRRMEEKFEVNFINGTSTLNIPVPLSASRNGFTPALGLSYNSGMGNSPFGLGWDLGIGAITRKTERKSVYSFTEMNVTVFISKCAPASAPSTDPRFDDMHQIINTPSNFFRILILL